MKSINDNEPEYNMTNYMEHLDDPEWLAAYHQRLDELSAKADKKHTAAEDTKWAAALNAVVSDKGDRGLRLDVAAALGVLRDQGWWLVYPKNWPGICGTCKSIIEPGTYHSAFNGNQMFACSINDLPECKRCGEQLTTPKWREGWWEHTEESSCEGMSMTNGGYGWQNSDHLITREET